MDIKNKDLYREYLKENAAILVENGIVLIPNMSSFTNFINTICIEAGRGIARELLSSILRANEIGMDVSEIEGCAVHFYTREQNSMFDAIIKEYESILTSADAISNETETIIRDSLGFSLDLITVMDYFIGCPPEKLKNIYGQTIENNEGYLKIV